VPLDQKIREADRFRYDEERLSGTLQMIERVSSTPRGGPHTGNSNCERCTEKRIMITQAYHSFYISHEPDRWDSSLAEYREEMERMFSDPEQYTLEDIHARFQQELRQHIKKEMCTLKRGDSKTVVERKRWSASQFDNVHDLKSTLQTTLEVTLNTTPREAAEAMYALHSTKTAHERAPVYAKYYCTPSWTDTSQQKNIKAKYARQFEAGLSHDQVITAWKNEVLSSQQQEISKLQHRLGELQMAQSAHLKNKAKKAEKDQRIQDREYVFVPKMERCTFTGCNKEVDVNTEGGALQCALCDWLAARYEDVERKKGWRFFYCSREHVEEDFVSYREFSEVFRANDLQGDRRTTSATNISAQQPTKHMESASTPQNQAQMEKQEQVAYAKIA
jgi:hypothetical protein